MLVAARLDRMGKRRYVAIEGLLEPNSREVAAENQTASPWSKSEGIVALSQSTRTDHGFTPSGTTFDADIMPIDIMLFKALTRSRMATGWHIKRTRGLSVSSEREDSPASDARRPPAMTLARETHNEFGWTQHVLQIPVLFGHGRRSSIQVRSTNVAFGRRFSTLRLGHRLCRTVVADGMWTISHY